MNEYCEPPNPFEGAEYEGEGEAEGVPYEELGAEGAENEFPLGAP